jgi:uncharacterized protein (DUF1778 family)
MSTKSAVIGHGSSRYNDSMASTKRRWDVRVAAETDRLVRQAAATADKTLTDFVAGAAVVEAERVLADRTQFVLDAENWTRFVELLDRPPRDKPGLETLFSRPSVFEER